MKQVSLGSTGMNVSACCLGCMLMGTMIDASDSFAVLDHFRESGGNFLDTANCYAWWIGKGEFIGDESEAMIGQWLRSRKCRHEIILATKVGARLKDPRHIRGADGVPEWDRVGREYEGLSAAVIRKGVEASLQRLQTDAIDLYYTHVFDEATPLLETLETLSALVREGKVRHLGCSNIATAQIRRARGISAEHGLQPYQVMQQEYSYLHPNRALASGITEHADPAMFDCARELGMAFLAYSPLLKGIYANKAKREQFLSAPLYDTSENRKKLALVDRLSGELGITGNQLVLAWLMRHDPQVIPLLGFSRKEQYLENAAAAAIALPDDILAELNAV